jgi:minor extracellular serine protease Vpr
MKKLIVLLVFMLTLQVLPAAAARKLLIIPSLPNDTQIAIVVLQNPQTEQEIQQFLAPYKDIRLRKIFREALNGFSVQGPAKTIAQLAQNKQIMNISPVNQYTVQTEEGVKIIGAEKVRAIFDEKNQRLTGKGITVGVIDTGIDYTHPDLRRNYAGGHDLVDQDKDPMETRSQGKATLHGTHVAGIIAANGKIQGVAPEAKIIAYRALGPGGGGTTEQVIAAVEQAIKDKVDIINLSLGNDVNGPDLPISLALNNAVDKGIVAVAANGNSGPNVWTVGSPGTATKAISVGASTPTMEVPYLIIEGKQFRIQPMEGSAPWSFERAIDMVDGGIGTKEDLQKAKDKIVLIKRGQLTFSEKAKNAQEAGASAVIIYNHMSGNFMGNLETQSDIPVASLSKQDGEFLKKEVTNRLSTRITTIEEKDRLADFSSRGPVTGTWEIKPDLVAPGVAINSTVPGGYLSLQGTSMAAPHVAGACALIKQAHPEWSPLEIKAALMNTAKPLGKNYRMYEQGAGRIQVDEAVKAGSLVIPSSLKFGKFPNSGQVHKATVKVENTSGNTVRYSFDIPFQTDGLKWRFPLPFTLGPKQTKDVTVELMVEPKELKGKIHDGSLQLNAGSNQIQIPYIYVLEEPNYPRVMGFDFAAGDKPGDYLYEVYLPGGAEEFGIALFNPEDYRFIGFLDTGRNVKKGLIRKEVSPDRLPSKGIYLAKVFAKKAGQEDSIEKIIEIGK